VADSWSAQCSEILAANPDLVIAAVPYQQNAVAEILKSGVRFLGLAPKTLADIYKDITVIAGTVGSSEAGDRMIAHMCQQIESVRLRTRNIFRPTVFCEEWGKPLISSQPWVAELVEAAGGEFIGKAAISVSPDTVADYNPDVVIAAWCGAGDRVPLDKIIRDRSWADLKAVRHSRVYCIRDELLNTPAPTLLKGLDALASAIHPEIFPHPWGLRQIGETRSLGLSRK
jgi:iron complex transport system substrate-binding protein